MSVIEPVFAALNEAGVRYVVVGGLATVLHGYPRLTADIDLIVDLEAGEAKKAIEALLALGFKPHAPVDPMQFADAAQRSEWARTKGMTVFSLWDPAHPMREVDLFVEHPFPFEQLWKNSQTMKLSSTTVRVASIEDLIQLKKLAGRDKDVHDLEALEAIRRESAPDHDPDDETR